MGRGPVGASTMSARVLMGVGVAAALAVAITACGTPAEPAPEEVEIGVGYAFDLHTHCGGDEVLFAGEYWETATDPGVDSDDWANGSTEWGDPYQSGTMTRISEDLAEFEAEGVRKQFELRPGATEFRQICA